MPRRHAIAFTLVALGSFAASVAAQSGGGPYVIAPVTIAGGGATLGGGAFQLSGTVGQPATAVLSASRYRLQDGFWAPAPGASPGDLIFADGFDP